MFTEITTFIKDLGFPIFVACFCLIKINRTLSNLEIAITSLVVFLKGNTIPNSDDKD